MGFAAIPFSATLNYATNYLGLTDHDLSAFLYIIRVVDNRLCVLISEKQKADQAASS